MQDGNPVAYASRALTVTQEQYAQIEKELLAVVFACNKFHDYAVWSKSNCRDGPLPPETLFKRPLSTVLQRL